MALAERRSDCVSDDHFYYRLYLKGQGGHFSGVVELTCADDQAAISLASEASDPRPKELWQRGRYVCSFPGAQTDDCSI